MTWYRRTTFPSLIARWAAIALVLGWTVVPALCDGLFESGHTHADVIAHDHADADADHDTHHNKLDTCCRSLADAKFLTAAEAELQPAKMILIAVVDAVGEPEDIVTLAKPVPTATGPPRSRPSRFLSYSPLAPPTRRA